MLTETIGTSGGPVLCQSLPVPIYFFSPIGSFLLGKFFLAVEVKKSSFSFFYKNLIIHIEVYLIIGIEIELLK
jgi:hypothetical protein